MRKAKIKKAKSLAEITVPFQKALNPKLDIVSSHIPLTACYVK
jgi:hypothetical protein